MSQANTVNEAPCGKPQGISGASQAEFRRSQPAFALPSSGEVRPAILTRHSSLGATAVHPCGIRLRSDATARQEPRGILAKANNLSSQAHILLVEDDASILDVSTFILQQNGYAVSMASNGKDALGMLVGSVNSPNPVDLVITDLTMPVMSGVDFIREMRKRDFSMPVVVTTGCLESYSETEIQNIRPDHILFKPFNPTNLTYCVKTILARHVGSQVATCPATSRSASGASGAAGRRGKPREHLDELTRRREALWRSTTRPGEREHLDEPGSCHA